MKPLTPAHFLKFPGKNPNGVKVTKKTFIDDLVRTKHRDPIAQRVARLLKLPAENHTSVKDPMIERFVFDEANLGEVSRKCYSEFAYQNFSAPLPRFIISCPTRAFFYEESQRGASVSLFAYAGGHETAHVATDTVASICGKGFSKIQIGEHFPELPQRALETIDNILLGFPILTAALCSFRFASVERILPNIGSTATERAFRRRQMQRGKPFFSFNRVTLTAPATSIVRGLTRETKALTPKRGHWVTGHWRLIAGGGAPYFTWVEAFKAGDPRRGWITKERHVKVAAGTRRGFRIPEFPGQPGERVEAIEVQAQTPEFSQ